jgi:hypothetical protein
MDTDPGLKSPHITWKMFQLMYVLKDTVVTTGQ